MPAPKARKSVRFDKSLGVELQDSVLEKRLIPCAHCSPFPRTVGPTGADLLSPYKSCRRRRQDAIGVKHGVQGRSLQGGARGGRQEAQALRRTPGYLRQRGASARRARRAARAAVFSAGENCMQCRGSHVPLYRRACSRGRPRKGRGSLWWWTSDCFAALGARAARICGQRAILDVFFFRQTVDVQRAPHCDAPTAPGSQQTLRFAFARVLLSRCVFGVEHPGAVRVSLHPCT